ncbi:hypothetical protein [Chthonobacter rhizosphaerae]|uniref:hypothetical protein n=1 Tax=Chthonobacter rhizosphaerae TaxID=2735553 RepID=UPI0015EE7A30|nr:hypothetical protein [Chthonobacter rhizosphaerae]
MKILEMLPDLDSDALATMRINAIRLVEHGTVKQKQQATEALPLIEAEQGRRAEAGPAKPKPRAKAADKADGKAPAKKAAAKKVKAGTA